MPRTTIRTEDVNAAADIAQSKLATIAADALSGNMIDGGTISNFASTGIDDNAAAVAMTIESDGDVLIGTTVASTSRLHVYDAGFPAITAERFKSGETNAIRDVANIILKTDADAADGFGPSLRFDITDSGVTSSPIGSIGIIRDGADNSGAILFRCGVGGPERVRISALGNIVMSGIGGIGNYLATMGDDAVTDITPTCNRGIIFVGSNSTHFGAGAFRCESGAQESYILLNSSGTLNFTTGVQTATSGTDGKLNVSPASDGKIYFNNRLGGGAGVWYTIVGAMW